MKAKDTIRLTVYVERRYVERLLELSKKSVLTDAELSEWRGLKLYMAASIKDAYEHRPAPPKGWDMVEA
jgi:hypothetical protein